MIDLAAFQFLQCSNPVLRRIPIKMSTYMLHSSAVTQFHVQEIVEKGVIAEFAITTLFLFCFMEVELFLFRLSLYA